MIRSGHRRSWVLCTIVAPWIASCGTLEPRTGRGTPFDSEAFETEVRPFLASYCYGCHTGDQAQAQLDLSRYTTGESVAEDHPHWALLAQRLKAKEMPPAFSPRQPLDDERQRVIAWVEALLSREARRTAGDPGEVLARRLSNAEYNYTVRDLTGVDIRPTREFPVDPANMAGFDNSGESLSMSPSLLDKYLLAAREVADHLVLKPAGIDFAPHLMLVETDRDKYAINQIIDFYRRHNTNLDEYFQAAWHYKHRAQLGQPRATLADVANARGVSSKYLQTVLTTLETREEVGPLATLQAMWQALPAPQGNQSDLARAGAEKMRDFVLDVRQKIAVRVRMIEFVGADSSVRVPVNEPFLMWRNRQYAKNRRNWDPTTLQVEGDPPPEQELTQMMSPVAGRAGPTMIPRPAHPDADLQVPAGQRERYEAAFAKFASIFPDHFYVSERGRYFPYPEPATDRGRHLSAGFHNNMGYVRDDQPFYELILDEAGQKELDVYWQELDFIADAVQRTYAQIFLAYIYSNADARTLEGGASAINVDEIYFEEKIQQTKQSYIERRTENDPLAREAVEEFFDGLNQGIRWVEAARVEAEPIHLVEMLKFAARAYRRPLTEAEKDDLLSFYSSLRSESELSHEEAMRDMVVRVLMSPHFFYRIDLAEAGGRNAPPSASVAARPARSGTRADTIPAGARPLSDYSLASRLSYFLWSSMPDDELLARAAAGTLRRPDVIAAQARRMLKDDRARGLATEFGGNWLDFRRFEENNTVDRERFPHYTNELRQAMFEEPIEFLTDVIQSDRSVLDLLYANDTFVNPLLAQHYGMPEIEAAPDQWVRITDAQRYGRGGVLPMSIFLTQNAPGLRTSPVKRGYWVVRRVLGETIPPPPPQVPELPQDEAKLDLPLRDALAQHRENPSCASCHARFDSFGLVFEGYGPVGERRTRDLAGRPVDTSAEFPGGFEASGLEGLRTYIRSHREADYVDNLTRKMLVFALGRSLMLSDEPTLESIRARLVANGYRFSTLVESIVTSPQFLTKRATEIH